jgi:excisionase family DNA binding protein
MSVYTPAALAREWSCSERHIRNLVAAGQLRAFRLGGKLLRIPEDAVQEFMACQTTASDGSMDASASPGGETGRDTVTRLGPIERARLSALRPGYTLNSQDQKGRR